MRETTIEQLDVTMIVMTAIDQHGNRKAEILETDVTTHLAVIVVTNSVVLSTTGIAQTSWFVMIMNRKVVTTPTNLSLKSSAMMYVERQYYLSDTILCLKIFISY